MQFIAKLKEEITVFTPVKADILKRLYQSIIPQIVAYMLALCLAVAILKTSVPPSNVYLWLGIITLTYLGRAILTVSYERTKPSNMTWLNIFRIATVITGIAWGASASLLTQSGDMLNQYILLFTLLGLCTGIVLTYAIDYIVLLCFLVPVTSPLIFRLMAEGTHTSLTLSFMIALYLTFVGIMARQTNNDYIQNIELAKTALMGESLEKANSHIMEMIANNKPLEKILETIARNVEIQNPSMLCSILMLDSDGKHLKHMAAPSIPDFYNEAINGIEIGETVGSCGSAAYLGKRVITEDISIHPNWDIVEELTSRANLRSCWSEPIKDSTGKVLGTFAIYHRIPSTPTEKDIQTISKNAALAGIAIGLANNYQEQRLAAMFYQNTSESMMITDNQNIIIAVNPAFTNDTGYSAAEAIGKNPDFLRSDYHEKAFYKELNQVLIQTGEWQGEVWNRRKNGEIYAEWIRVSTIYSDDGKVLNRVSLATDITKRKENEEIIWKQANFDGLTGLPNRRMFHDRFQQEIKKSQRANLPLALMFIDLDEFKEVNDALGHQMGDDLLIETAKRLTKCVRESDTVAHFDSVARLGGDEFTIILGELEDTASIERIAQRILSSIAEPYQLGDEFAYISASIGITLYPNDSMDIDTLIKNADQAMYAAKSEGRNRFSYFTASMQENVQQRLRLTNDLRSAIAKQQFHLVYQPIVNLETNEVHKAEALIRWQHPKNGLVNPDVFIPIAEDTGLINEIGNWVFLEAISQALAWRESIHPDFQISINKSPVQFTKTMNIDHSWPKYLRENDISGECIAIEITEGLLLDSNETVHKHLLEFRDAGIQVALDDFGTGYSSLSYLKKFDIDYIKIDQSFVQNLAPESDDMALCQAIIVMAHKLKLKVIAEGIETQDQLDLLKAAGCDFGQGYFISKPLLANDFERLAS